VLLKSLKTPLSFFLLLCSLQVFYLLGDASWWVTVLCLQGVLAFIGLFVRSWRLYGAIVLALLGVFAGPWFFPSTESLEGCGSWSLQGRARVETSGAVPRVQLVQVRGSCGDLLHDWPVADIPWKGRLPWFMSGDMIQVNQLSLVSQSTFAGVFQKGSGSRVHNLSRLDKIKSRSALLVHLQAKARTLLSPDSLALYKALITADRSSLSTQEKKRFKELGIAHLLAISGMHTGIVFLWINLVLRLLLSLPVTWVKQGRHLPLVDFCSLGLLFGFLWVIGLPVSALRAWLMLLWWMLNKHWFHHQKLSFILAGTAQLILLFEPWAIGQISFQLSFLSVAGILWVLPFLPRSSRKDGYWIQGKKFVVSSLMISCWLFVLNYVIVAQISEFQSFLSPFNNLIHITFVGSVVMPVYLLGLCVSVFAIPVIGESLEVGAFWLVELVSQWWHDALLITSQWNQSFLFPTELDWNVYARLSVILGLLSGLSMLRWVVLKPVPRPNRLK